MIREAIEYLVEMGRDWVPIHTSNNGIGYVLSERLGYTTLDKIAADKQPKVEPVVCNTLSGIVDFASDYPRNCFGGGGEGQGSEVLFEVSLKSVRLMSFNLDPTTKRRSCFAMACFNALDFDFDTWLNSEIFLSQLKTRLSRTDTTRALEEFVLGTKIVDLREVKAQDGGMAFEVMVRSGVANANWEQLPQVLNVTPFITFPDVVQPKLDVSLMVKKDPQADDKLLIKLVLADGGRGHLEGTENVATRLRELCEEREVTWPVYS